MLQEPGRQVPQSGHGAARPYSPEDAAGCHKPPAALAGGGERAPSRSAAACKALPELQHCQEPQGCREPRPPALAGRNEPCHCQAPLPGRGVPRRWGEAGTAAGTAAAPSPTQAKAHPGSPRFPSARSGAARGLSRPLSGPRKALPLPPTFRGSLSPRGSPGAEGHGMPWCEVSPEEGVFPARIFALGEKVVCTANWGLGGDGLQARPRLKTLPARCCLPHPPACLGHPQDAASGGSSPELPTLPGKENSPLPG